MKKLSLVLLMGVSLVATACGGKDGGGESGKKEGGEAAKGGIDAPAGMDGAKKVVEGFLKSGADATALTQALKPQDADYAAVFEGAAAGKAKAAYSAGFKHIKVTHKPKQTEYKLWKATAEELQGDVFKSDAKYFPGGYKKIAKDLKKGVTWYRFKFVEKGKDLGMGWDGLVHVNGHWAIFPKPWRAIIAGKDAPFDSIAPFDMKKMLGDKAPQGTGSAANTPQDDIKACEGGDAEACANAGGRYLLGKQGMPKDPAKGAPLLKKACDGGSMFGCEIYGRALQKGLGVAKNPTTANVMFTKACNGKRGPACRSLALAMPSKDPKRIPLLTKACGFNDKIGCVALGAAYLHGGQGAAKDLAKAKTILGKACKLGEKMACKKAAEIK